MRKKLCVLAMAATVMLTGCSANVPKLSKLDNSLAAQYLADSLLRNEKNYEGALEYDHALLTATPTPVPTAVPTAAPEKTEEGSGDRSESSQEKENGDRVKYQSVSLSEVFGDTGVKVKAQGYQVAKSYGTDYASYTAGKGKKLVIARFSISNASKSVKRVNFAKQKLQAELLIDGKSVAVPLRSIVEGDMQFFREKLAAGQKKQGVLIFELDKAVKVNDVQIHFVNGSKEASASID